MPNVKFSYLYRDSCNYKTFGFVIFANSNNLSLEQIKVLVTKKLIDETWFYADLWNIPDLRNIHLCTDNDPTWHEFENVTFLDDEISMEHGI